MNEDRVNRVLRIANLHEYGQVNVDNSPLIISNGLLENVTNNDIDGSIEDRFGRTAEMPDSACSYFAARVESGPYHIFSVYLPGGPNGREVGYLVISLEEAEQYLLDTGLD